MPGVVESSLGLFIYDFFFEREVQKDEEEEKLSNAVKVDDNTHHTTKRAKFGEDESIDGRNRKDS